MSKEAAKQTGAEDLALRIRPGRHVPAWTLSWLGSKSIIALAAAGGLLFTGAMFLVLRDTGTFSRRKIEFPPLPQLNASIAAAQERLKENPQDIVTLVELGTLHFEKGKDFYADAINELEEARDLGALDPRIFYCLGIMYQEVGLYNFALDEYKRFLRHYPEDKEIRMLTAKLLYKQGRYPEAVSEYERLRYQFPSDALVQENLGLSLWGAKTVDRSEELFGQLRGQGGDLGKRAAFYLGQIAMEKGQAKDAVDRFLECQPRPGEPSFGIAPEVYYAAIAAAYQKNGQLPEAKAAWERVLLDAPNDAKAKSAVRDLGRRLQRTRKKP